MSQDFVGSYLNAYWATFQSKTAFQSAEEVEGRELRLGRALQWQ